MVDLGGARRDFRLRELLHGFAQRGDVLAMVEGQAGQMEHVILALSVVGRKLFGSGRKFAKSYCQFTFT
jgi:hypothetical protein